MEIEVEDSKLLPDGKHEGEISKVEYRNIYETNPDGTTILDGEGNKKVKYKYVDIFIKPKDSEFELRYGTPARITEKTKLGRLLSSFKEIVVGHPEDPDKILIGKKVQFMTMSKKTTEGEFVEIVDYSIKPLK